MKVTKIFLLLSSILLIINVYIFINRDSFMDLKQSSYNELYPNYNALSIKSFDVVNDSTLSVKLNNEITKPITWIIKKNGIVNKILSKNPTLTLDEGISNYNVISSNFKDSLQFKIEYYTDSFFKKLNSNERNRITIFRSKLPSKEILPDVEKWRKNKIAISTEELKSLKLVLENEVEVKNEDSSFTKAQKIIQYLCYNISKAKGTPNATTKNLSVYKQYLAALKNEKIDCGIYANIFSLFATHANITNRIIELKHNYGTFDDNIHVFNEYYMYERKKWAATDIMLNKIAYVGSNGELMNAVQVKNQSINNNGVTVIQSNINAVTKDSINKIPFSNLGEEFFNYYCYDRDLCYYYDTNLNNVYSLSERTKRYFIRNDWMEIYSDVKIVDNKLFYVKQFLIITLFVFIILIAIFYFVEKRFL
jgi:hypothetical protein